MTPEQLQDDHDLQECLGSQTWDGEIARKLRAEFPDESATEVLRRLDIAVDAEQERRNRRKALGVASQLEDWMRTQPGPVTARQIREHFNRPQQTVHNWLLTLERAGRIHGIRPTEITWAVRE